MSKDHLGSITGIMNSTGEMLEEYNYDPWGRRRNVTDWSYSNVSTPTYTQRGFTGHEHLDMFELINMNGRVYDPVISRFLSPDPFIQDPYNLLNYNRYTYCLNNPLKYIDPSGYIFRKEKEFVWMDFSEVNSIMDRLSRGAGSVNRKWRLYQAAMDAGYNKNYSDFAISLYRQVNIPLSYNSQTTFTWHTWERFSSYELQPWNVIVGERKIYHSVTSDVANGGARFPLNKRVSSYFRDPARFGDSRDDGDRKHGGCDLYAPVGTHVYAVKSGFVIQNPYKFYRNSSAIEINHGDFIIRYAEIDVVPGLIKGSYVDQGQLIGFISNISLNESMLHFEMFSGTKNGSLTDMSNPPYFRRSDLLNPTQLLIFGY